MKESLGSKLSLKMKLKIVLAGILDGNISRTCEKFEISRRLFYRWKEKYQGNSKNPLEQQSNIIKYWLKVCIEEDCSLTNDAFELEKAKFEYYKK